MGGLSPNLYYGSMACALDSLQSSLAGWALAKSLIFANRRYHKVMSSSVPENYRHVDFILIHGIDEFVDISHLGPGRKKRSECRVTAGDFVPPITKRRRQQMRVKVDDQKSPRRSVL